MSPGIYGRAFIEGRLTEEQLNNFRQEVDGKGLPSYPHPHLMPDFWQFPTVSMGLGPIQAIYLARFLKYLTDRGIKDCSKQRVYCFLGDGETDEPESLGAIGLAAREELDNLTFVINCNLQRLDGPVRGKPLTVTTRTLKPKAVSSRVRTSLVSTLKLKKWLPTCQTKTSGA